MTPRGINWYFMSSNKQQYPPIPPEWLRRVIDALKSGEPSRVFRRQNAIHDWYSTFPDSWEYQWNHALITALSMEGVTGRRIPDMVPPCEAYAFWFFFEKFKLYAKIGLLSDNKVIIIFSSHRPRKGDEYL